MRPFAGCRAAAFAAFSMLSAAAIAQNDPPTPRSFDRAAFGSALARVFDRDAGTPIGEAQKAEFDRLLAAAGDADLGEWGYAPALSCYFRRDPLGGVAVLETFFAKHDRIPVAEHATMAGRIYLVATMEELRKPPEERDHAKLCRWGERTAALYPDLAAVGRMAAQVLAKSSDPKAYRVALIRGLRRSVADDEAIEALLAEVYAPREAAPTGGADRVPTLAGAFAAREARTDEGTAPAAPNQTPAGAAEQPSAGQPTAPQVKPDLLAVPIETVVGSEPPFSLTSLRGKIAVLELFASWNPPSRAGVTDLQKLVAEYGDKVGLVSITRFYGRGMDFAPTDAVPHGGTLRDRLDRTAELDLHKRLHQALGLTRPLAFVDLATWRDTFKAGVLPTLLVLGTDGKLLARIEGAPQSAHQELRNALDRALATAPERPTK